MGGTLPNAFPLHGEVGILEPFFSIFWVIHGFSIVAEGDNENFGYLLVSYHRSGH